MSASATRGGHKQLLIATSSDPTKSRFNGYEELLSLLLRLREQLRSIVMSMSVCVSVCLSARISPEPIFKAIFVHVAYVRGSVLLRRVDDRLHRHRLVTPWTYRRNANNCIYLSKGGDGSA